MKALLGSQDVWEVVEECFEEPKDTMGYMVSQNKALKEVRYTCCFEPLTSQTLRRLSVNYFKRRVGHFRKSVKRNRSSKACASTNSLWRVGEHEDEGVGKCIRPHHACTNCGKPTQPKRRNVYWDASCREDFEIINQQLWECCMRDRRVKGPRNLHGRRARRFSRGIRTT